MKTKKTHEEAATPTPKGKVKIKNLKLQKETIADLSDHDAGLVKGGITTKCPRDNSAAGGTVIVACWIARAVYGEENPRWMLFRDWLTEDSPAWFHALYLRHGERFALWLAPHTGLKAVIRFWMDSRIERKQSAARLGPLSAH